MSGYRKSLWANLHPRTMPHAQDLARAIASAVGVRSDQALIHRFGEYPEDRVAYPVAARFNPSDEVVLNPDAAFPHYISVYVDLDLFPEPEVAARAISKALGDEIVLHTFEDGDVYRYSGRGGPAIPVELDDAAWFEDLVELSKESLKRISALAAA